METVILDSTKTPIDYEPQPYEQGVLYKNSELSSSSVHDFDPSSSPFKRLISLRPDIQMHLREYSPRATFTVRYTTKALSFDTLLANIDQITPEELFWRQQRLNFPAKAIISYNSSELPYRLEEKAWEYFYPRTAENPLTEPDFTISSKRQRDYNVNNFIATLLAGEHFPSPALTPVDLDRIYRANIKEGQLNFDFLRDAFIDIVSHRFLSEELLWRSDPENFNLYSFLSNASLWQVLLAEHMVSNDSTAAHFYPYPTEIVEHRYPDPRFLPFMLEGLFYYLVDTPVTHYKRGFDVDMMYSKLLTSVELATKVIRENEPKISKEELTWVKTSVRGQSEKLITLYNFYKQHKRDLKPDAKAGIRKRIKEKLISDNPLIFAAQSIYEQRLRLQPPSFEDNEEE